MKYDYKYNFWLERLGLYDTNDIIWFNFNDPLERLQLVKLKLRIYKRTKLLEQC